MKKNHFILAAFIFMFAAIAQGAERPNVLIIIADDMGYGDISCNGAHVFQTPNIDAIATEGIRFTDGHSYSSNCSPSRYGLMTGRNAFRTWMTWSAVNNNDPLLIEDGEMTLASMFKEEGYNTAAVGKWHLGWGREARGVMSNWNGELKPGPKECGFDYNYVFPTANSLSPYVIVEGSHVVGLNPDNPITKLTPGNGGIQVGGDEARWKDEELAGMITDAAITQLQGFAQKDDPFFLYYAPHQPHSPWIPGPNFEGKSGAGAYGDVILELDWSVGKILRSLKNLGLADNTLVIFSSDNGASINAVTKSAKYGHLPNGILRGQKSTIYEGGNRVPFLARWPGKITPGTVSNEIISQNDMMATLAAILEKDLPPGAAPDSYNALPELLGQPSLHPDRPVLLAAGTGALIMRFGNWKYYAGQDEWGLNRFGRPPDPEVDPNLPLGQLYNLDTDLGETNNRYEIKVALVDRMKSALDSTFYFTLSSGSVTQMEAMEGDGSPENPYQLTSAQDLQALSELVNSNTNLSPHMIQMNDIDMSSVPNFAPIAYDNLRIFSGSYDGNNYGINNLTITKANNYVGLFGVAQNATFQNIRLNDVNIVTTFNNVGALLGNGLKNCLIVNCYVSGIVEGKNNVGGLVGWFHAMGSPVANNIIKSCYSNAHVHSVNQVGGSR